MLLRERLKEEISKMEEEYKKCCNLFCNNTQHNLLEQAEYWRGRADAFLDCKEILEEILKDNEII